MKRLLTALLAASMVVSAAATVSAWEENADYIKVGEITSANYPASTAKWPEVTTGQLMKGTIIAGTAATPEAAAGLFDGDATTSLKIDNPNLWVGIQMDQAYALTEIRYVPNPAIGAGESGWLWVQGSNDGENWVNIISMRQDATGKDYMIFTPQTVTDQRYIDAGYGKRFDESIHWIGKEGDAYSMYRINGHHVGDVEFYGNPAPATDVSTPEIAATKNITTPYYYPHKINIRTNDVVKNSVDGSLVGTIISGGGVWNKALYDRAFDGNNKTCYDPCVLGTECWVGMMFDEPHALTEVRLLPKRGTPKDISFGHFQGSLDGTNWVDLATFSIADVPNTQEWVIKEITDTKGYTYFRYVSAEFYQSSAAEILLFGAPAPAAEPFTVDPMIASTTVYSGEIVYADVKNVIADTEISGTPIAAKYHRGGWYGEAVEGKNYSLETYFTASFDNNVATGYSLEPRCYGSHVWIGLAADEPTVVGSVKLYGVAAENDQYFQGSNDGYNWVTLATFNMNTDAKDAEGWTTHTVTDTNAYSLFRVMADQMYAPGACIAFEEMKIYAADAAAPETAAPETAAPETAAPETAAPETAAPETAAPETAAPETAAPETAAPETTAPETAAPETTAPETTAPETDEPTAPQTFDFGVIAAAAAVISAAGYAIARKRK